MAPGPVDIVGSVRGELVYQHLGLGEQPIAYRGARVSTTRWRRAAMNPAPV